MSTSQEFLSIHSRISTTLRSRGSAHSDFESFTAEILELERIIFSSSTDLVNSEHAITLFSKEERRTLNDAYAAWETELEKRFADDTGVPLTEYPLYSRFVRLIRKEIALLQDYIPQNVLFIGSGPFPISALLYAMILKTPVVCVEQNEVAVKVSRELIARLNLSDSITVVHTKGELYPATSFDLVVVALLAKPKAKILSNLFTTLPDPARVICRTCSGLRALLYEPLGDDVGGYSFTIKGRQEAGAGDTISSLLLGRAV